MKPPTIVSALICEDIRQEMSGKFSLAGVFGSDMNIMTIPAAVILGGIRGSKIRRDGENFFPKYG